MAKDDSQTIVDVTQEQSMYKRILVSTDGSDISQKAVQSAIALARSTGGELFAISVKEPFPYSAISEMQPVPPQEFFDAQERIAGERVKAVVSAAAPPASPARPTPWRRCTPGKPSSTTPSHKAAT